MTELQFEPILLTKKKTIAGIPAYNKERTIGSIIHGAEAYVDEVIVVDDGSVDRTSTFARATDATVIRHKTNLGKAAAVQTIIDEAIRLDADALVLLDADFQHDPDEIPQLLRPILGDGYDLVLGSRKLTESRRRGKIPFYRPWGQFVLGVGSHLLAKKKYSDPECGFRALSRAAMEAMGFEKEGFFVESEMIYLAVKKGLKVKEVPITEIYEEGGSTLNPFRHGLSNLSKLIVYVSEKRPLFFFGIVGTLIAIFGAVMGARVLYIAYFTERGVALGSALVAVLFIAVGVFTALTGMILNALTRFVVTAIREEKEREAKLRDHEVSKGKDRGLIRDIKAISGRNRKS
jgi:glycosyltransferase involved in cell wall biosynthesis